MKPLKIQKTMFCDEHKELTRAEYTRLVNAAQQDGNERLSLVLQTICATGIRVSELQFITTGAVESGKAEIYNKGKRRTIFLPEKLRHLFARTYYSMEKDLFRLTDILGHSNVNTTCIYTIESGKVHTKQVECMGLIITEF